jgi:hypothetical protein
MLYFQHCSEVKKILPVVKIQNGGCMQDGVENLKKNYQIFSKMIIFKFCFFKEKKIFNFKI